jgi:hypothetical protein
MGFYIDNINKQCFIVPPKCGTTTVAKKLNLPNNKLYLDNEIIDVLKDKNYLKIIVVRDVIDRFLSGFYEDLYNNKCYNDLDITFKEYMYFLKFCFDNKLKNINNINVYFNINKEINWGNCSNLCFPITTEQGNISGHIASQKNEIFYLQTIIDDDDNNVIIIDVMQLSSGLICNYTNYNDMDIKNNISDIPLSEIKNKNIITKQISNEIKEIINYIYKEDIDYINELFMKYSKFDGKFII